MRIPELQQTLQENHSKFVTYVASLTEEDFSFSFEQKWTAGQQLDHILKSVTPVSMAIKLPGFLLKFLFGVANRPSRNYNALVERYQQKLLQGGKAPSRFIPAAITIQQRSSHIEKLNAQLHSLEKNLTRFTEEQLDKLLLPHPLLGKLTLREMMYFTIYHVQHHENLTRNYLLKRTR